jgi:hypothetical protein
MARPETLELVPESCVALQLSKWNTGIGWFGPGRILEENEVEIAWQNIIDQIGQNKARWHTYDPALPGFG